MRRFKCPICLSKNITKILDLGNHPLADTFFDDYSFPDIIKTQPLIFKKCNECFHFFLSEITNPVLRYQKLPYSYTTGNSKIALSHFKDFAKSIQDYGIVKEDLIIDIGGNDGTLLSNLMSLGHLNVLNIEPSYNISQISENIGIRTINSFFSKDTVNIESNSVGTIVSANVVNHIDDCNLMMEAIDHFLQIDGLFIFQVPHVVPLLRNVYFETIYHEHVHYFSVHSVSKLLAKHGFYIEHIEQSGYMCGSIRFYCKKGDNSQSAIIKNFLELEKTIGLTQTSLQDFFIKKSLEIRDNIRLQIIEKNIQGSRVVGFCAATKANTLLNFCGLTKLDVPIIYDTSIHKIGKFMPGSNISILDESKIQKKTNDVAIILADNMRSLIEPKLKKYDYETLNLKNIIFKEIEKCRVCGSTNLETIIDLGNLHLSNFIDIENNSAAIAPLELVLCKGECQLVQLKHTVSNEIMFRNYWYLSSINHSMISELKDITVSIEKIIDFKKDDIVIDIGSNDGTLLRQYSYKSLNTIGFEPALNLSEFNQKNITKIIPDFFSFNSWKKEFKNGKAKVITAIGMFYDLDEPKKFVEDIYNVLEDDGLFVIQMMYLPFVLKRNAFDGICHEHLEYYSISSLEFLLGIFDLKIVGLEIREKINEGSVRFYITKKQSKLDLNREFKINLDILREEEKSMALDDIQTYIDFNKRINETKDKVNKFLNEKVGNGEVVHGYAASTKGNTTLQFYGITPEIIKNIADKNPMKWGKKTAGSNIEIISEKESRLIKPSYYFVLAWHFIDNFLERETDFLNDGGKFIIPMPDFEIIDKNNYLNFMALQKKEAKTIENKT